MRRRRANFSQTRTEYRQEAQGSRLIKHVGAIGLGTAIDRLQYQLDALGATDVLLSTNVQLKLDGRPRASLPEPPDVGAAVYFRLKGRDRCFACDAWTRVADNITAIANHVDALRRIGRYGIGDIDQAFAGYVGLPAKGSTWRTTLGFRPDQVVTVEEIDAAFRERARAAHPDAERGSHDAMASLTMAREEGREEVTGDR